MFATKAEKLIEYRNLGVLLKLATSECNLHAQAKFARELDSDATLNPSKTVIKRLNKCRSSVFSTLNTVLEMRSSIKNDCRTYEMLHKNLSIVKTQHDDIEWIPKSEQDSLEHPDLLLRIFSQQAEMAEKQLDRLRETFQTLTTAITIEDLEFNKLQARRATMLTLLAAIYLPLILATSIFGMNIQEINGGQLRWWVALIVTAVLFLPSVLFMAIIFVGDGMKEKLESIRWRKPKKQKEVQRETSA